MDEMRWLGGWLFVRGINRLVPHAFYSSAREDRISEKPPDLSWYNLWWPHNRDFAVYTNRLSRAMTGQNPLTHGVSVNDVAPGSDSPFISEVLRDAGYRRDCNDRFS